MTVLFLVVISTKHSAWRNSLRQSCTYPPLSFYPHKLQRLCFLIHSFNFLQSLFFFPYTRYSLLPTHKQMGNPRSCFLTHPHSHTLLTTSPPTLSFIIFIPSIFIYRCYNMLYLAVLWFFCIVPSLDLAYFLLLTRKGRCVILKEKKGKRLCQRF